MMTNLHARSTPTRDRDNESLSEAIRRGQREAIAETLSVGRSVPAEPLPSPVRGDGQGEVSPHAAPAPGPDVHAVHGIHKLPLLLVLVAWILFTFGIFTFASAPSIPSRPSVKNPEPTSAFATPLSPLPPVKEDSPFPSLPLRPSVESSALLAEVAAPAAPALGSWLISATAALSILVLGKQLMRKTPLEAEFLTRREFQDFKDKDFADLRNRIDRSHETLANKLDTINARLSDVGSLVARLDERTKNSKPPTTDNSQPINTLL